ncbi:MAG: MgtC/SapB family protein [Pseudanabaena sp. CRU_2_10]|nr:MgtC/SapB family protein [Pseudanabaena sp. CRU_2_10]
MDLSVIFRLAIALALGLIIGMERGWQSRDSPEGLRSAGFRSFGFVGLFGGASVLLAEKFGVSILVAAFLGLSLLVVTSYVLTAKQSKDFGITTELCLLIAFVLGALAGKGLEAEALAAAVIAAGLLGFKQELHQSLERLDRRELIATLQLLIVAAVALPLLPNRNLGPWESLNPRTIGLMVSLIAGVSYVGYFAIRLFGSRVGLLATGVLGGLASSTAVTVSLARMARQSQASIALLAAGISLASGTMIPRLLVLIAAIAPSLLPLIVIPLGLLAVVPLLAAFAIAARVGSPASSAQLELKNPIELGAALFYGVILTVLFVLVRAIEAWFGNAGVYTLATISGLADVDAVSISLAQATKGNLPLSVAANGIIFAAIANTAMKALLAGAIGGWKLARWCGTILLIALCMSLGAVIMVNI